MKILVAEDNADSRIYLERILKSSGYAVDSAGNGRAALVKAQASPPDLIVSDILMPEMDGFALCRHWKDDALLRRIPFVFYTATYTDSRDEELALNLGADRFVIKPQPPEVLLQIIRDVFAQAGPAQAEPETDRFLEQYNSALFRKLEQKVQALEREVAHRQQMEAEFRRDAETARQMQAALLAPPPANSCVEVAAVYQPGLAVGGDLYFLDWRCDEKLLRGFLFAAMGEGLSRALYAAAVQVMLREINETDWPLPDQVRRLNRLIRRHFGDEVEAKGIALEIDLETRELRWVNAGLDRFWLATAGDAGLISQTAFTGAEGRDSQLVTHTLPLAVADTFYFCTKRAGDLLAGLSNPPLDRFPEMVARLRALTETTGTEDVAALCLQIRQLPETLPEACHWPRIFRLGGYGDYQRLRGEITRTVAEWTGKPHSFVEVAVNEALANAMECRDGVARPHQVRLRINAVGRRLIVRVKSTRMGFAGNALLERLRSRPEDVFAFGGHESMGRGVPLMLSLSDKILYSRDGTEVLLAWRSDQTGGKQ